MKLYLLRHGEARNDAERALSERGVREVEALARAVRGRLAPLARIEHSARLRARQSAGLVHGIARAEARLAEVAGLDPNDDVAPLGERLQQEHDDLMLVGHLPHLALLASALVAGRPEPPRFAFEPATLLCLERQGDWWRVLWMLRPDLLSAARA